MPIAQFSPTAVGGIEKRVYDDFRQPPPFSLAMTLEERCRSIALLLSDVDGVLTDGQIMLDNQGIESKAFHVRDGLGIKLWQKAGYQFGMLTLRSTQSLKVRAAELGIEILRQGVPDKLAVLKQILAELKLTPRPRLLPGR